MIIFHLRLVTIRTTCIKKVFEIFIYRKVFYCIQCDLLLIKLSFQTFDQNKVSWSFYLDCYSVFFFKRSFHVDSILKDKKLATAF